MGKKILIGAILSITLMWGASCEYNDLSEKSLVPEQPETNESLTEEINAGSFHYFRNGELLSAASASPHGSFKLRFNEIAWSALDSNEELTTGGSFPAGAIIVKEAFAADTIRYIAAMKKKPADENAGEGWVWLEYGTNGALVYGVEQKGVVCVGCHSVTPHRDFVRTFDLH